MLTSELVRAREEDGKLVLTKWRGDARRDAVRIADRYLEVAREHVGEPRDALVEAWKDVEVRLRLDRVAEGLKKLILDGSELEAECPVDPVELRAQVFTASTHARREATHLGAFDREAVLRAVAAEHAVTMDDVERWLFSDLRGAHRLLSVTGIAANQLVDLYDLSQEQAVLLRAVRVIVDVTDERPVVLRALFRKLKFHRLLFTLTRKPDGAYRIELDGPYSMFTQTTKYGLQLALLLPALRSCRKYELMAHVRWGKTRKPLVFETTGGRGALDDGERATDELSPEVQELYEAFHGRDDAYEVALAEDVLVGEGQGVCVPDLVFTRKETGEVVFLEVLGFWSREAVWKRIDLARSGLTSPVLFAAPQKLRVSEAALEEDVPSALYVYKGKMRATAVRERLDAMLSRTIPATPAKAPAKARARKPKGE
jgi:predicted nuclease of restriction endonuclease-like RecB superfamily